MCYVLFSHTRILLEPYSKDLYVHNLHICGYVLLPQSKILWYTVIGLSQTTVCHG